MCKCSSMYKWGGHTSDDGMHCKDAGPVSGCSVTRESCVQQSLAFLFFG